MLTGRQVRQACELLRWDRYEVQRRTALPLPAVDIVTSDADHFNGTRADEIVLKDAFHRAGIEFTPEGPRLRRAGKGEAD